jgi:hypothetical protein
VLWCLVAGGYGRVSTAAHVFVTGVPRNGVASRCRSWYLIEVPDLWMGGAGSAEVDKIVAAKCNMGGITPAAVSAASKGAWSVGRHAKVV